MDVESVDQQLRALADAIPLLAWMARPDGSIAWFNCRWHEFTGITAQSSADWGWRSVHHPDHVDRVLAGYRRAIAAGEPWEDTFPLRGKDGLYRWFLTCAAPMRDATGRIERWFGTNTDVTAQIESAEKLRESEARFRALVAASPLGITIMDMKGQPVFYNPQCEKLHGMSLNDARGEGWARALHPDDHDRIVSSWRNALESARPWAETYRFVDGNGRTVWVSGRAAAMHVAGTHVGYVGTLEDITELKTAEFERERSLRLEQEARRRAQQAARLRDETLGIVAHDLRNPLHTLAILATRMLKDREDASGELRLMLRIVDSMSRLIRDLLDVSTIETGGLVIERTEVDVCSLLRETAESFEGTAMEKHLALTCEVPEPMPYVLADRGRLAQVLGNLVGNAIKFTPAGGKVRLFARTHEGCVHVSVADTGTGIAAENVTEIFDRFWQAHRTADAGAGLGLAIAKGIIEAHGGRIWVMSALGRGTTMSFSLPTAAGSS